MRYVHGIYLSNLGFLNNSSLIWAYIKEYFYLIKYASLIYKSKDILVVVSMCYLIFGSYPSGNLKYLQYDFLDPCCICWYLIPRFSLFLVFDSRDKLSSAPVFPYNYFSIKILYHKQSLSCKYRPSIYALRISKTHDTWYK